MTALTVENLSLKYGDQFIFKDLNFTLDSHDFLCIVGPNGSGKSTLLKCLLGEIHPTSGKITFHGQLERHHIGYLPQSSELNRNFPASVYEIASTGALNQTSLFSPLPKAKIQRTLKTLRINSLAQRHFSTLSGGQRQKVLLARAIIASSELLILDEPSNTLDYRSKQELIKILQSLNRKLTIIMVTHDLDHRNLSGNKILSLDPDHPFFGSTAEYVRRVHAE